MTYTQKVEIVDYNPQWPQIFLAEKKLLLAQARVYLLELEHIGSTAIPGQRAKPIIDMMGAIQNLDDLDKVLPQLQMLGYQRFEMGMKGRHFLSKKDSGGQTFHLHLVEISTWPERKERLMRDYLLKHPESVKAYGNLKDELAERYAKDSVAYTKAKTEFIQAILDKARAELNLPPINVWED